MSHSWFAASRCKQYMLCGASAVIDVSELPRRPKPAADLGTLLHHFGEQALRSGGDIDESCDGDHRISVQAYVDYVRGLEGWHKFYEFQTLLTDQCGGTADCVAISPDGKEMKIIDYKSGRWFVDPVENYQLIVYGCGVLKALANIFDEVEEVELVIIQPALDNFAGWTQPVDALLRRGEEIASRIHEIMDGDAEFEPSDEACQWCPGKDICPERARFALHAARLDFEDRDWDEDEEEAQASAKQILDKEPEDLTWSDRAVVAEFAASWASGINSSIKSMMLADPDSVDGFKVVDGRRTRVFNGDEGQDGAVKYMRKHGFKKSDLYSEPSLRSPSQFESLFKGKGSGELKKGLKPFIVSNDGPPTVVRESDPRMAARDFASVEDDDE
jgi:hypothetical protein